MSKDKNLIHFIVTGGTMDSVWDGSKDTVVVSEKSVLPEFFANLQKNLKFYVKIVFTQICMKDSRAINDIDRKKLLETIEASDSDKIIITHGTYTTPDTARFLNDNLKRKGQTIILTGSMVPIKGFDYSDGPFNLGYALAQVQNLSSGVYLCMNARVFAPEEVRKNTMEGKFYSVFEEEQ